MPPASARPRNLLVTYLKPQRVGVMLLAVLLFASIGLQLAGPQVLSHFIDAATGGAGGARLRNLALLFIGVALAQQAAAVLATSRATACGSTSPSTKTARRAN